MKIVVAGILKKVFGGSNEHPLCPYRKKPIKCKGRLSELLDENGRHRKHHSGIMPDPRNQRPGQVSIRPDTDSDPVPKIEAQCDYCLATFWGRSLETISDMFKGRPGFLPQDYQQWFDSREIKVMKRFPKIYPEDQIARAEEQARR